MIDRSSQRSVFGLVGAMAALAMDGQFPPESKPTNEIKERILDVWDKARNENAITKRKRKGWLRKSRVNPNSVVRRRA